MLPIVCTFIILAGAIIHLLLTGELPIYRLLKFSERHLQTVKTHQEDHTQLKDAANTITLVGTRGIISREVSNSAYPTLVSSYNTSIASCPWTKFPCIGINQTFHSPLMQQRSSATFIRCSKYPEFFSGAWLAATPLFLATKYQLGNGVGGAGVVGNEGKKKTLPFKTQSARAFFVEHLSGLEHNVREHLIRQRRGSEALNHSHIDDRSREAARCRTGSVEVRALEHSYSVLGLVPYFGGTSRNFGGNFEHVHSFSPISVRLRHLAATVCSIQRQLHSVVVGVCRDFFDNADRVAVERTAKEYSLQIREIVELDCGEGHHLPIRLLLHAQSQLRKGSWAAKYVYYTEADHLLHLSSVDGLLPYLDHTLYLVPYRFTEWFGPINPWAGAGGVIRSIHRTIPFGGKKFEAICLCTGDFVNRTLLPRPAASALTEESF
uniref:Uncharacterized protein n=1 Tax=Eutreptiella gymnastica TaxID=73025 RepID=A0A7S1N7E1_9EUGL|mmetsp:Transcript_133349/g.231363  ORF Transcript_133349/g.231363 Transcript_133349/m.231363 type:complete len:435 (+) Transcript_133349:96-1400(+)